MRRHPQSGKLRKPPSKGAFPKKYNDYYIFKSKRHPANNITVLPPGIIQIAIRFAIGLNQVDFDPDSDFDYDKVKFLQTDGMFVL